MVRNEEEMQKFNLILKKRQADKLDLLEAKINRLENALIDLAGKNPENVVSEKDILNTLKKYRIVV